MPSRALRIATLTLLLACCACDREQRKFSEIAPLATLVELPGDSAAHGVTTSGADPARYRDNAYAVAQGQRLFVWFNCVGCHGQGDGCSGPALMDHAFRYGSDPAQIFITIAAGRPNGMPAYGGKLPEQQIWQLVGYVRSLSGRVRADVAPGRSDTLSARPTPAMDRQNGVPRATREVAKP